MEDRLIMHRETVTIEGGRNLYNYTFREETPLDRLLTMIETGEVGVVGAFLDAHPTLDVSAALEMARERRNQEAVREIESRQ
jgi:hypothetical protein